MTNVCIATVTYPGVRSYLPEFFAALNHFKNYELYVLEQGESGVAEFCDNVFSVSEDLSIPAVRSKLFSQLKETTDCPHYIFVDSDDRLRPNALDMHCEALENSDFSYGDQVLYQKDFANPLGYTLFEKMHVPERLESVDDLMLGNCVGLSALAVTRKGLEALPKNIPESLTAIDWFAAVRLLQSGLKGQRVGCVTDYRLKGQSLDVLGLPETPDETVRRAQIVLHHYRELLDSEGVHSLVDKVKHLIEGVQKNPEFLLNLAKEILPEKFMWYEDVTKLAQAYSQASA